MLVIVQNLGVRRIIPTNDNDNIMGSRRDNVMWTIKLIFRCRMFLIKTIFTILKYLLIYSSSTATAYNPKIIVTEMDRLASLFVFVTMSSLPILGYRLINMLILADVFMLLSCHECHGFQCFKLCDINEK